MFVVDALGCPPAEPSQVSRQVTICNLTLSADVEESVVSL